MTFELIADFEKVHNGRDQTADTPLQKGRDDGDHRLRLIGDQSAPRYPVIVAATH